MLEIEMLEYDCVRNWLDKICENYTSTYMKYLEINYIFQKILESLNTD